MATDNLLDGITKCWVYTRVSSVDQMIDGNGLDTQESKCREFADALGLIVEKVFTDGGITGANIKKRDALKELIKLIKNVKEPHLVLAYDTSRIARDSGDSIDIYETIKNTKLHKLGFAKDGEIRQFTAIDKFVYVQKAAFDEFERANINTKARDGINNQLKRGVWLFSVPFGLKRIKHQIIHDGKKAEIVKEAYVRFADGRLDKIIDVRDYINNELKTIDPNAKQFCPTAIKEMLTNKQYTNIFAFPKRGIPEQKWNIDPIIDLALFERVQKRLKKSNRCNSRTYNVKDPAFPLRHYIKCPHCNSFMTGYHSKNRYGVVYDYYKCGNKECTHKNKVHIRSSVVHDVFKKILQKMVPNQDVVNLACAMLETMHKEFLDERNADNIKKKQRLSQLKTTANKTINTLINTDNEIVKKTLTDHLAKIQHEIDCLTAEIESFNPNVMPLDKAANKLRKFINNLSKIWENGSLEQKRCVQDLCFDGDIFYDDEKICRTTKKSPIFEVFDPENEDSFNLVGVGGFEPPQS
ncbi:MAG: recombinase family protein [Alphaproteobacteria bacterium]|nr:recombinase family protein [Alphaproteobacteria bacterium]